VFNSFSEFGRYGALALDAGKKVGIRINPEFSTQKRAIYDPCAPGSRLGVTASNFPKNLPDGVSGLHFHTLCEQDSDALIETLDAVERLFGGFFHKIEWINFGGGHHITRQGYAIETLTRRVRAFRERYGLTVYLEPGEAVALDAGVLAAGVLDIVSNGVDTAVLDASAACHMPDVLEAPYRPSVTGAGEPGEKRYTYRLAGRTCLAGDVVGDYSFDDPLRPGDTLIFENMAIYTTVKNNTFNGTPLPSIAVRDARDNIKIIRSFGYGDFKERL
jgi:carboxynorspermidine decarboxylase